MIEREGGMFAVSCDKVGCDTQDLYDTDGDWNGMIRQMKADGWEIRRVDGEFEHVCPGCADEEVGL